MSLSSEQDQLWGKRTVNDALVSCKAEGRTIEIYSLLICRTFCQAPE